MRRAFTLVEMLVVIGIIGILAAIIIPAASMAVSRARTAAMALEVAEIGKALESYKLANGDYPPSMGEIDVNDLDQDGDVTETMYQPSLAYLSIAEKHLRRCYPNISTSERAFFYTSIAPNMGTDEALVFWLSLTHTDERLPFTSPGPFRSYYSFAQERLSDNDGDQMPSFAGRYSKGTAMRYFDARHYLSYQHGWPNVGPAIEAAQPYGDYAAYQKARAAPLPGGSPLVEVNARKQAQYVNQASFQVVCAGQDGKYGIAWEQFEPNGTAREWFPGQPPPPPPDDRPQGLKMFASGTTYTDEDFDNVCSFSAGTTLGSSMP